MESLKDRIRHCETLPTLPAAALLVLQLTEKDTVDASKLAQIISQDPALSGKVLRAVNSPFYGLSNKVSNIGQAVALLGMHSVKTLVLGFSLVSTLQSQRRGGFDHLAYWRRSMYAATAARVIAGKVASYLQEECFLSALLMDIGTLLLDQLLDDRYGLVFERAKSHQELTVLETHEFGMSHAEAGAMLAEHWKLPAKLATPIGAHHGPHGVEDNELKRISEVVWLAGRCADVFIGKDPSEAISSVRRSLRELYKLDEVQCDTLLCQVSLKTNDLAGLFDVRINNSATYDQILHNASERLLALSIAEENGAQSDKRQTRRMRRDGKIMVTPCARGILSPPIQVKLRDLSAVGIGLTHTARLEPGTQFIIQLPEKDKSVKTLLYTVKRCETYGGLSSIGGELSSVLRVEAVQNSQLAAAG
jgi:two-component system, cell cycle response regulator